MRKFNNPKKVNLGLFQWFQIFTAERYAKTSGMLSSCVCHTLALYDRNPPMLQTNGQMLCIRTTDMLMMLCYIAVVALRTIQH